MSHATPLPSKNYRILGTGPVTMFPLTSEFIKAPPEVQSEPANARHTWNSQGRVCSQSR